MNEEIGALIIRLQAELTDLKRGMTDAELLVTRSQKQFESVSRAIQNSMDRIKGIDPKATAQLQIMEQAATRLAEKAPLTTEQLNRLAEAAQRLAERGGQVPPALQQIIAGSEQARQGAAAMAEAQALASEKMAGLSGHAGALGQVLSMLGPWGAGAAIGIGALSFGAERLGGFLLEAAKAAGDHAQMLAKLQMRTGMTQEAQQGLLETFNRAELGENELVKANDKLLATLSSTPGKFSKIGMSVDELRQTNPDELLTTVLGNIQGMPTQLDKVGAASEIFGKRMGSVLLTVQTSATDAARQMGIVWSSEQIAKADAYKEEIEILGRTWEGFIRNIGLGIATSEGAQRTLTTLSEGLGDLSREVLADVPQMSARWSEFVAAMEIAQKIGTLRMDGLVDAYKRGSKAADEFAAAAKKAGEAPTKLAGMGGSFANALNDPWGTASKYGAQVPAGPTFSERAAEEMKELHRKWAEKDEKEAQAARDKVRHAAEAQRHTEEKNWEDGEKALAEAVAKWEEQQNKDVTREFLDELKARAEAHAASNRAYEALAKIEAAWEKKHSVDKYKDYAAESQALSSLAGISDVLVGANSSLSNSFSALSSTVASTGQTLKVLEDQEASTEQKAAAMVGAFENIVKAGQKAGPAMGALAGGMSGAEIGASVGGPWGAVAGAGIGALGGLLGGLSAQSEEKHVNDLRDAFTEAAGGIQTLAQQAAKAGTNLDAFYSAKTEEDFTKATKDLTDSWGKYNKEVEKSRTDYIDAAGGLDVLKKRAQEAGVGIEGLLSEGNIENLKILQDFISGSFAEQDAGYAAAADAAQRYGLSIDQLGPLFAKQQLDTRAAQLYKDFTVLTKGGADVSAVTHGMSEALQSYVTDSLKAGIAIPENMRPALQSMADQGLLVDEAGNKLTDLSDLTWGKDLSSIMQRVAEDVEKLVNALYGVVDGAHAAGSAIASIPSPSSDVMAAANERPGGYTGATGAWTPQDVSYMAAGGIVTSPTLAMIGEGGQSEAVIPLPTLASMTSSSPSTFNVVVNAPGATAADASKIADATVRAIADKLARNTAGALTPIEDALVARGRIG